MSEHSFNWIKIWHIFDIENDVKVQLVVLGKDIFMLVHSEIVHEKEDLAVSNLFA